MSYSPTPVPLVFLCSFSLLERLVEYFIRFSLRKVVLSDEGLSELVAQSELKLVISLVLLGQRASPRPFATLLVAP